MDLKDQINSIIEKKKNKYSKSYRNKNRYPKERLYIEGDEIKILSSLIEQRFENELSSFGFDFLRSIERQISNIYGNKLFLSDKQINILYDLLLDTNEENTDNETLGFFFKKQENFTHDRLNEKRKTHFKNINNVKKT